MPVIEEDRFAGFVAHELRTPLATQRALLELALDDPGIDLATWREIGVEVLAACRLQERMLEACLALARSRDLRRREPVDLAVVVGDALRAHDQRSLTTVSALEPARTIGDPNLVARLVANLMSNAIRHNVAGGRIEVVTGVRSGRAVVSIANTGPRIPAAELPRLFEPFQRLDARENGVGLGLSIVRAIANVHGATVAARPRRGGGLGIDVAFEALT